jgi:LSD1 subclass zinc finger protein
MFYIAIRTFLSIVAILSMSKMERAKIVKCHKCRNMNIYSGSAEHYINCSRCGTKLIMRNPTKIAYLDMKDLERKLEIHMPRERIRG